MNNFAHSSVLVTDSDPVKVEVHALFEIRGCDDEMIETYFVTTHMVVGTCWDDEVPACLEELRRKVEREFRHYYAFLLEHWVSPV